MKQILITTIAEEKLVGILFSQINPGYSQLAGNFKLMGYSALK